MNDQLAKIARDLGADRTVPHVTTREFLSWFDAQRRGYWVVEHIRNELAEAGLETVPDFQSAYIDAPIELRRLSISRVEETGVEDSGSVKEEGDTNLLQNDSGPSAHFISKDPTYRLSKLAAANQGIVSVTPDSTLRECVTKMLLRDFSQLPVMTNAREVKGVVTWKTMSYQSALSQPATYARDAMIPHHEIRASASIFEAIPLIVANEYVLVRDDTACIAGIITATDLSQQFRLLSEPFLLLGEIENLIRGIIGDRFSSEELISACNPSDSDRKVQSPADMNFGEYVRLLQNPDRWKQVGFGIDGVAFCKDLDDVREIRNNVMHFDPEGIVEEDLNKLRTFTSFLKHLQRVLTRPTR